MQQKTRRKDYKADNQNKFNPQLCANALSETSITTNKRLILYDEIDIGIQGKPGGKRCVIIFIIHAVTD